MLVRLTGILEEIAEHRAVIAPAAAPPGGAAPTAAADPADGGRGPISYEVLLPAYLGARLLGREGERLTLHTIQYLESVNQGASFLPRLIGFASPAERRFFELFTSVKGLGNRRALRALAEEPATIARWIAEEDLKALQRLPEIGKRLAETIVVDLREKMEPFLAPGGQIEPKGSILGAAARPTSRLPAFATDAVEALITLGETRAEAERKVATALQREPTEHTETLVAAALGVR
jgi:Holliday junction DNA helicase RuvA